MMLAAQDSHKAATPRHPAFQWTITIIYLKLLALLSFGAIVVMIGMAFKK